MILLIWKHYKKLLPGAGVVADYNDNEVLLNVCHEQFLKDNPSAQRNG